ncbi:MAG: hypothetical protein NWF05_01310 [Candidatus Bathyarchaeota archaeon]|nr:hypothetical protein [Candidatus Bathyarchaeota archaeon]
MKPDDNLWTLVLETLKDYGLRRILVQRLHGGPPTGPAEQFACGLEEDLVENVHLFPPCVTAV